MKTRIFIVSIWALAFFSSCFSPAKFTIVMQRESMEPPGPIHVGESVLFTFEISNDALLGYHADELTFEFELIGEDVPQDAFEYTIIKGTEKTDTIHYGDFNMICEDGIWSFTVQAKANVAGSFSFAYGIYHTFDGWGGMLWTMRTGEHYGHHELTVLE